MDIIYILIPVTMLFIGIAIGVFFWSVKSGQYDDVDSPASRILFDDDLPSTDKEKDKNDEAENSSDDKDREATDSKTDTVDATATKQK